MGVGAYVDVRFSRWVQLEAEGRWQRFNQYDGIHQDNYLAGPRIPIHRIWKGTVYGKALVGLSQMSCAGCRSGHYTDFAFGGGMDMKLTKRLSFRAVDAEYQYYPNFGTSALSPYGVSMGIGYKIF
jgi:opacity protein-like surface antigen